MTIKGPIAITDLWKKEIFILSIGAPIQMGKGPHIYMFVFCIENVPEVVGLRQATTAQ